MVRNKKNLQNGNENNSDFNTLISLDFLLNDILGQILSFFFKGVDLMEKFNAPKVHDSQPQNNFIEGVEEDRI